MQTVRFEGIADTSLGADCFVADTILKSLALGQMTAEDVDIPSYFDMLLDGIREDGYRGSVSSRLWGYPRQPSLIGRENTFAIRDLKMGVQAETVPDPNGQDALRDEIADDFAQQLTKNYEVLSSEYPELGRMAGMFRLAALAYGMRSLRDSPNLSYWLDGYDVPLVETETEYPELRRAETLDMDDETLAVQVEGGIGMDGGTLRLEDGDLSVLHEAVLKSRPDQGALTWRISLRGAWFEGDAAPDKTEDSPGESGRSAGVDLGTYLTRRVEIVPRPVPGLPQAVRGNAQVNSDWRPIQNQQAPVRAEQAPLVQPLPPEAPVLQPPPMRPQVPPPYVPQPRIQQAPVPQPRFQQPPPQVQQPQAPQPQAQQQAQQPQVQQSQGRSQPAQQSAAQESRGQQSQGQNAHRSEEHQSGAQHR